jgi:AcrR family transcriptional regulator
MILDVAFGLFLEHGYKGTSMDAIARAAGVTKPVIYSCFPSKSELFLALLDREEQRMLEQLGAVLRAGALSEDLETTLIAAFTALLQAVTDTPDSYRMTLLGGGELDAMVDARVRRGRERHLAGIELLARSWLEHRVPASRLDSTVQFVGQTLLSIGEGGMRTMLDSPGRWTPKTLGRELGGLAANGYLALMQNATQH